MGGHGHEFHGEHDDVDDEESGGDGRVAAEKFGESLADLGHRESEIGAAVVAARRVDANERAARRTDLRAGILIATAAEETAYRIFPAVEAVLPLIGKRQLSSWGDCAAVYDTGNEVKDLFRAGGSAGRNEASPVAEII